MFMDLTAAFLSQKSSEMGSNKSVLQDKGYTLVSEQENKTLVKNKGGDQFLIKKLKADQVRQSL